VEIDQVQGNFAMVAQILWRRPSWIPAFAGMTNLAVVNRKTEEEAPLV
jgi:hypothetical protein